MTQPRSQLIVPENTPYYHCVARCVRRAFLCGQDHYSGRNFDHRKPWVLARLKLLEDVFAINIAAYAVMSNHYHVVLYIDKATADHWGNNEVIRRWLRLHKGPLIVQRYQAGESLTTAELVTVEELASIWRKRLCSISWFMACLNEHIARKANQEDKCKGRFWEGRFKSQALLDEAALLSCMTYVDLNPVRAGISQDLFSSDYTSVQDRLNKLKHRPTLNNRPRLMALSETISQDHDSASIPYSLESYLELADWTGRSIRHDKRGFIPPEKPKILKDLTLSKAQWLYLSLDIQKKSISMLNGLEYVEKHNEKITAS